MIMYVLWCLLVVVIGITALAGIVVVVLTSIVVYALIIGAPLPPANGT